MGEIAALGADLLKAFGETNLLRAILARNMPEQLFREFQALDRFTVQDCVIKPLGMNFCRGNLWDRGLTHVGDVVGYSRSELAKRYQIPICKLDAIERFVAKDGLSLGFNNRRWREYRELVPADFRLFTTKMQQELVERLGGSRRPGGALG